MRYDHASAQKRQGQVEGPARAGGWDTGAIDALTETVVTRLLVEGQSARGIARDLAARLAADYPLLPALALSLPFSLAASAIEDMLGGGAEAKGSAADAWRIAALIGADALVLGSRGAGADTLAGLWALWQKGDEVFGDPVFGAGHPV